MKPEPRLIPFEKEQIDFLLNEVRSPEILTQCAGTSFHFPLDSISICAHLSRPEIHAFLLVDDEHAIGYGDLLKDGDKEIRICRLLISSKRRGKGYGKMLVQHLCNKARSLYPTLPLRLFVIDENQAALHCYLNSNFKLTGIKKVLPDSMPPVNILQMEYYED